MTTPLWAILVVFFTTIISAFAAIYLKKASDKLSFNLKFLLNKNFILSIFFYAISTIFYFTALKFGELSILYPMLATVYIWISFLSQRMLNENMNFLKWFGIIMTIIGITLLGLGA